MTPTLHRPRRRRLAAHLAIPFVTILGLLAACSSSSSGSPPSSLVPDRGLGMGESPPGLVATIVEVSGASGSDASFQAGDLINIVYTVTDGQGTEFGLLDLDRGAIMVSGPTFNYQRVIASQSDLLDRSVTLGPGRFRYTFAMPIPERYMAPLNDSGDLSIGELTGQLLLAGTYTVGIEVRRDYTTPNGDTIRDPANATFDFRFGGAPELDSREVVTRANCNQCHDDLRAHGDNRTAITNCLLCHTAGAEDRNVSTVEGGTPAASIEFKEMIHKIHAGKALPSVLGVTTNTDGTRNYAATPKPYKLVGFNNSVHDYSKVGFPVWPSAFEPMPADTGYEDDLTDAEQDLEDAMLSGPVACAECHGDPDGSGPLAEPAQGQLAYTQPSRVACGSCHDDWVWDRPYTANMQTMRAQENDAACTLCHSANDLIRDHTHPLADPDIATGAIFELLSVTEDKGDGDDIIEEDETIAITFTLKDLAGNDLPPTDLSRMEIVVNGPTDNPQMLMFTRVDIGGLTSGPVWRMTLPQIRELEYLADASSTPLETFQTSVFPHWNNGASTTVYEHTGDGALSTLTEDAAPTQSYVDVAVGTGSSFEPVPPSSRYPFVVIDDGDMDRVEYLKVQYVEGDRVWFSSPYGPGQGPALRNEHDAGVEIKVVTLDPRVEGTHYSLDATSGTITELPSGGFGDGNAIVVTYTSDFVVPRTYGATLNESPDLDESHGKWNGKPLVQGTYTVGIYGRKQIKVNPWGEETEYNDASPPATLDFLIGEMAGKIKPNDRIDSDATCVQCHEDVQFHGGGRRGYATCLLCHGLPGAEDRATYAAPGAPHNGVTIDFRTMLHKIHHGKELAAGKAYEVIGFGGRPHTYEGVGFPVMPGGTKDCASCHGDENTAWMEPANRDHPTAQTLPVRAWRATCGSCHDSSAATAHIDANTSPTGAEACAVCHGKGKDLAVDIVHRR